MTKKSQSIIKFLVMGLTIPAILWLVGTLWVGSVNAKGMRVEIDQLKVQDQRVEKMFSEIRGDIKQVKNYLLRSNHAKR